MKKTRYAGSEVHLTELLEGVCSLMQNYGESTDPKTGEKGYLRINSRPGETITISNVNFSSGGGKELSDAVSCVLVALFPGPRPASRRLQYGIAGEGLVHFLT